MCFTRNGSAPNGDLMFEMQDNSVRPIRLAVAYISMTRFLLFQITSGVS
jgi:hypothetical protein